MKPSMTDSQNAAGVADASSVDPAILQQQLAAQKDDYLRLAADFDNFKKRTRRDSGQQAAAEKESFILDLLPVLDNLERALACGESISFEKLHQGVEMTRKQLEQVLFRHNIEAVEALNLPFDPHRHEAVSVGHDPSQPDHIVLEVIQRGYGSGGKVFRPAKVIVNDLDHSPEVSHAS
jgi:molecular chaperone GrpE